MNAPVRFKVPESVLVVIHTPALEVLLIRRADAGTWQSVTGAKDEPAEDWAATAVREVAEETGIDCSPRNARHALLLKSVLSSKLRQLILNAPGQILVTFVK